MMSGSLRDQVFEAKLGFVRRAELEELRALMRNERLDPEALRGLQEARTADLVRFAVAQSDYYRERYARAGIDTRDLADPQAFQSLPVLERADVRENFERIRSSRGDTVERPAGGDGRQHRRAAPGVARRPGAAPDARLAAASLVGRRAGRQQGR